MAGVAEGSSAQREVEPHEVQNEVLTAVMHGNWEKVLEICKTNPSISIKINGVGETILHVAIHVGNQYGVIQLMDHMEKLDKGKMEKILQTGNHWGNTPLHQAAFMGMDKVCSFIARHYCTKKVVCCRNKMGETPLHVAVLHGWKRAFFALQMVMEAKGWRAEDYWNTDGDTILHSAVARGHFGE
ncbi:uncharacterized protein [Elaeis guineensis]|uniref:Homeobox protein Wariai-like n=1 Tax=Elaeis guineensis var. tenera TaxID=51953 RepID=A0A6I9S7W7_ELAGV|nr:homeobox protein Wariai-like [Elaeis guineensis]